MQPSTDRPTGGTSRQLRRYGPVIALVAVIAVVAGVLVFSGGGDDDEEGTGTDEAATGDDVEGAISFSDAEEEGLEVTFSDTCDQETGRVAIPFFFAPECYADVEDNGGDTATGVTGDSIKVVVYQAMENDPIIDFITAAIDADDTNAQARETIQGYVDLFQAYYQTYDRTVEVEYFTGSGNAFDATSARADAVEIAEKQPFAVLGGPVLATAFADELAARGVICIGCLGAGLPEWYEERAPYVYGIVKNASQNNLLLAEYIEKRLAGDPAIHAGDEEFQDRERVFGGLYIEVNEESNTLAGQLRDDLAEDGIELVEQLPYTLDPAALQEQAATAIAQLKTAGATTVIFLGDPVAPATFTQEATAQDYFPEWVIGGSVLVDTAAFGRTYDQEQWSHAFGFSGLTARTDPEIGASWALYEWFTGETPPADETSGVLYPAPGLFFAGLQAAGPNLTPETFRDGLFAGEATPTAITAPSLSYGDKGRWPDVDYNGIDDIVEFWWDPEAEGPDEIRREGQGLYQYVDGGRRYLYGEQPDTPPNVFDPEGAVTILSEPPPDETPPDYPSPAGG